MADFASALLDWLEGDSRVTDIAAQNLFWVKVPGTAPLPYVRLQTISDPRPLTLKGYRKLRSTRVQADCFAAKYGTARKLAEAIIAVTSQPALVGEVQFGRAEAEGPRDLGEDTDRGFIHRASVDLLVWHSST